MPIPPRVYAAIHLRLPYSLDKSVDDLILQANRRDERNKERPFLLLKPRVFIDGNKWCALYGENLQDGVAGFGDSPELAAQDFDRNWLAPLPSVKAAAR